MHWPDSPEKVEDLLPLLVELLSGPSIHISWQPLYPESQPLQAQPPSEVWWAYESPSVGQLQVWSSQCGWLQAQLLHPVLESSLPFLSQVLTPDPSIQDLRSWKPSCTLSLFQGLLFWNSTHGNIFQNINLTLKSLNLQPWTVFLLCFLSRPQPLTWPVRPAKIWSPAQPHHALVWSSPAPSPQPLTGPPMLLAYCKHWHVIKWMSKGLNEWHEGMC